MFQLTPARGERHMAATCNVCTTCFNSRPRAASDSAQSWLPHFSVFQLTPARGERLRQVLAPRRLRLVSTHARARRATVLALSFAWPYPVSTHARARRATSMQSFNCARKQFQLTPARGERPCSPGIGACSRPFQLTPARGERLNKCRPLRRSQCFNSRPRAASDRLLARCPGLGRVSTHARARRAT